MKGGIVARALYRIGHYCAAHPLRVLLTNICLNGRSGTEIVTRNIALALLRPGHLPTVFTLEEGGSLTQELRMASVPVNPNYDYILRNFSYFYLTRDRSCVSFRHLPFETAEEYLRRFPRLVGRAAIFATVFGALFGGLMYVTYTSLGP